MEYVTFDDPMLAAIGALPGDFFEVLIDAYRAAHMMSQPELPVIEW